MTGVVTTPEATQTPATADWPQRQFRAPAADRGLLVHPAGVDPELLLRENRVRLDDSAASLCGEPLESLRRQCRRDILKAACDYTARLRSVRPDLPDPDADLIAVGHQPGLPHPGVWLKNFAAAAIAERVGGTALNVIVDSDQVESLDVQTLSGSPGEPHRRSVPLDSCSRPSAWEDVRLHCPDAFATAGQTIAEDMRAFGIEPLAIDAWKEVGPVDGNDSVVDTLTRMRHRLALEWGSELLEVPLRQICRLPCFAQFLCHVIGEIESLHTSYNTGLATYRRQNGLRSDSHPMPDLQRLSHPDGGVLLEAPLWVWRAGDERRRPLYVRRDECGVRLFDRVDGQPVQVAVVRGQACDWSDWHRVVTDLDHQWVRVRPRALMTTLFLRVCLGDLFIHGIGGAKYDEVTDWLIRDWLGLDSAPEFLTVSGTLRLPVERPAVSEADERAARSRLRGIRFNPERHGASGPAVDRKHALIGEQQTAERRFAHSRDRDGRRNFDRYREIQRLNDEMAEQLAGERAAAKADLIAVRERLRQDDVLSSREYPWVSYPAALLREWLVGSADEVAAG